jgi:hypothetical protein
MRGVGVRAGLAVCLGLFAVTACAGPPPGPSAPAAATRARSTADLPAPEILSRARAADAQAASFTMTFGFTSGPDRPRLSGRLSWDRRHGTCAGGLTLPGHGEAELVTSGRTTWLKPDAAFARAEFGPASATLLAGRYLKGLTADPHFSDFSFPMPDGTEGDLCQYGISILSIPAEGDEAARKLGTTTLHGVPVVEVQPVGKGSSLAFVATQGPPYLLQAGDRPAVGFTDFGRQGTVVLPPDAWTVPVTGLPGR